MTSSADITSMIKMQMNQAWVESDSSEVLGRGREYADRLHGMIEKFGRAGDEIFGCLLVLKKNSPGLNTIYQLTETGVDVHLFAKGPTDFADPTENAGMCPMLDRIREGYCTLKLNIISMTGTVVELPYEPEPFIDLTQGMAPQRLICRLAQFIGRIGAHIPPMP